MPLILPIKQWRRGDVLVDPTGAPYEPNSPPALIAGDVILGPAITFARENARRIGVTILCGLQTEDEDLGRPGTFEKLMDRADLFGSSNFDVPVQLGTEGYVKRVETTMKRHAQSNLLPFNTMQWDGMDAPGSVYSNLGAMRDAIDNSVAGFRTMQVLDMGSLDLAEAPEEIGTDAYAGEVHLTNHMSWVVVANTCYQIARMQKGRARVLIDEGITGFGIANNFDVLGVRTEFEEVRRDAWPQEAVNEVLNTDAAILTGRIQ